MPAPSFVVLHSFPGRAEQETAQRIADAAHGMGMRVGIATCHQQIPAFAPDFVLCLSHHETRPPDYPSYGVVMAPLSWITGDSAALGQILAHDGFLTVSPTIQQWLVENCATLGRRAPLIESFYPTTRATSPPPATRRLDHAAYVGTNWDGWRNLRLFQLLSRRRDIRCYGPQSSWSHLPASAYGGELPFDGASVVRAYANAGIGLGLERPDFLPDSLPSNRIFEIAAAGAVPLMANTPFVNRHFDGLTLPLDHLAPMAALAWQIGSHLDWIASHPDQARALADAAHARFNRDWAMEVQLQALLRLHQRAMERGRDAAPPPTAETLANLAGPPRVTPVVVARFDFGPDDHQAVWPLPSQASVKIAVYTKQKPSALSAELRNTGPSRKWSGMLSYAGVIGGLYRFETELPDGLGPDSVNLVVEDSSLVAMAAELSLPADRQPLAQVAASGRVWIYGTGEGGVAMARHLSHETGHPPAGFIDDFRHGQIDGITVHSSVQILPALTSQDHVILANQHWAGLWRTRHRQTPARFYVAHPEYGPSVLALPKVEQ